MPLLIIEGCDGTGKSTLATRCVEAADALDMYNVRLEHYGVPKYDPDSKLTFGQQAMNQLMERFQDFNFATDFVVVDRFHWGEPVYAPVFRPDLCIDPLFGTLHFAEFWYVEQWVRAVNGVVAYCTLPYQENYERLHGRGEPDLILDSGNADEKLLGIMDRYEKLYSYLTAPARGHRIAENIVPVQLLEPADTDATAEVLVTTARLKAMDLMTSFIEDKRPPLFVEA